MFRLGFINAVTLPLIGSIRPDILAAVSDLA